MGDRLVDTLEISEAEGGVTFTVKVISRAHRNQIAGIEEGQLRVRINAPPVEGRANRALLAFLAGSFKVKKAAVQILRGETSRYKLIRVRGMTAREVRQVLAEQVEGA